MNEFGGLGLDRLDDFGVAMARRDYGDPGGEVEKLVSVGIGDDCALATLGHQWITARVRG